MKTIYYLTAISMALLLSGCVSTPPSVTYNGEQIPTVGFLSLSCSKPYDLSQDCSSISGAKRKILFDNHEVRIAGTEDGTTILIMAKGAIKLETMKLTIATSAIEDYLVEQGFTVLGREAVAGNGEIAGYFLIFDGDAYSLLREFTQDS
jgi:PBP1b-binding outer membrane lipoprotein LpoB